MLSPLQKNISSMIYDIVPQFPKVVADLVSEYVDYEIISRALGPVEIAYEVSESRGGRFCVKDVEVSKAIQYCLSSEQCEPAVKLMVLQKFALNRNETREISHLGFTLTVFPRPWALATLARQMHSVGSQIWVNNIDFSGINLESLDLYGASAVGAKYRRCRMTECCFRRADLTFADFKDAYLGFSNFTLAIAAGANLSNTYLRSANFESADLTGAYLMDATLAEAVLWETILIDADLTGANLTGAHLGRANLTGAILSKANLTGANLTGADLTGANLTGANLTGAILKKCILKDTIFEGANMTGVKRDWCLIL